MMSDVPPAELAALARHRGLIDAVLACAREGLLGDDVDSLESVLADALEATGIRAPHRHVDALRRRFPTLYGAAESTLDAGDRDLVRQLNRGALHDFATELLDLEDRIHQLEDDPIGYLEQFDDERPSGTTPGLSAAAAAELYLENYRDQLDELVGASYASSHG